MFRVARRRHEAGLLQGRAERKTRARYHQGKGEKIDGRLRMGTFVQEIWQAFSVGNGEHTRVTSVGVRGIANSPAIIWPLNHLQPLNHNPARHLFVSIRAIRGYFN